MQTLPRKEGSLLRNFAAVHELQTSWSRMRSTYTDGDEVFETEIGQYLPASVKSFFEKVYPLPSHAFLHPETTRERCREGKIDPALGHAICALATLHSGSDFQIRDRAAAWVQTVEQRIWQHLENPTIPRLQALLLVIRYQMETWKFQRAFMLTATAARFAAALRLNHERPDLDFVAQEVRRRIMWSLKVTERYFSVGLPEFEACPIETIYLQFPRVVFAAVDAAYVASSEQSCLLHATAIIQILTNLNQYSTSHLLLEFDAAICAYHATRLLLFISQSGRVPDCPSPEFAVSRAALCLAALKRFFPSSALAKPIIDDMERLTKGHAPQESGIGGISSPDFQEGSRKLDEQLPDAAKARQRLAIHSLLRQADFTDEDDGDGYSSSLSHAGLSPVLTR
ncbi:uncharacterized protein ColSpa_06454 [Colletotrichum spaethianum]|uniref:Xylanolytic transcriptional activator regulatory domain-containing protein n=1 Tax=Colletotrichum spaethianum TaxID=700344 RepID=A0AA37LD88_9PEZI|nr:uncharacterized protein ColSpa_06454 [Colletotrichum spaethianum]GKT46273.1 hypothetical protein ColSpa_06454 [Colletotrichum spaethianum]